MNNLQKARKRAGKSQQEAADILETTQVQISKYERDIQDITLKRAVILADFYECSLDYIAGRTEQPENPNIK